MILPVIMAGGSGSRLWPLSRQLFPKQFLPLVGERTMLQDTCDRLQGLDHQAPLLICGEDHRFTVAEQLRLGGYSHSGIVLEPAGRNTAPAVALAALQAGGQDSDPLLLVLAADHVIQDVAAFQSAVAAAVPFAERGKLVTFGIVPTGPETGYGYIRRAASGKLQAESGEAYAVEQFVEKPDLETAQQYVSSGDFYWNSGMFLFKASRYIEELKAHRPDILIACEKAMSSATVDSDFIRPDKDAFLACPDDSIDYAVMEPLCSAEGSRDTVVVPMDCGWSDVGSWSALWEVSDKDESGNSLKGDVLAYDSRNCFVQSNGKLIATVGLDNVVVVESDDAIMVAAKDRVQDVKKIVEALKASNRPEARVHRKVYRPWGFYDSIDQGEKHRLENPGTIPLEIIEAQSGSYLGEDDIVRFEDSYGR